jgi:hypothetical protein
MLKLHTRLRCVVYFMLKPLYSRRKMHCTNQIKVWVGPSANLDVVVNRKNCDPDTNKPRAQAFSLMLQSYSIKCPHTRSKL